MTRCRAFLTVEGNQNAEVAGVMITPLFVVPLSQFCTAAVASTATNVFPAVIETRSQSQRRRDRSVRSVYAGFRPGAVGHREIHRAGRSQLVNEQKERRFRNAAAGRPGRQRRKIELHQALSGGGTTDINSESPSRS